MHTTRRFAILHFLQHKIMNISRPTAQADLVLSRRIRKTPYEERVFENGVKAFTTYNHMPLASVYSSSQEDYDHLCEFVQIWDVACERQIEIVGPDALKLVELVTPRDVSKCKVGQCMYAILVDEFGNIINDPILIKLAEDRYWLSIADSGVLHWVKGIAFGRNLDVNIFEPDVSPLAIQGPRSYDLMAEIVGEHIRDLKYFWFTEVTIAGLNLKIAKSGWSGQGGYEIYLEDGSKGLELWDAIWQVGEKYNIRAGCPNLIDRIERGLLSYGSDMVYQDNPYECGLDRFFEDEKAAECMSSSALAKIRQQGVKNKMVYMYVRGEAADSPRDMYQVLDGDDNVIGGVTSLAYSNKYTSNISFATIDSKFSEPGTELIVVLDNGQRRSAVVAHHNWDVAAEKN